MSTTEELTIKEETVTKTVLHADLKANTRIQVYPRNNTTSATHVITKSDLVIYDMNIYDIPVAEKDASIFEFPTIILNPEKAHDFIILTVTNGIAIIKALRKAVIIKDGDVIGLIQR